MADLVALFRTEPAYVFLTLAGAIVGLVVAFANLSTVQNGYLVAIVGGVGTLITAFLAKPANVAVIGGAVATILSSLVVFNIHLSGDKVHAIVGAFVIAVGFLGGNHLRAHLTPTVR